MPMFSKTKEQSGRRLSLNGNEIVSNSYDVLGRLTEKSNFNPLSAPAPRSSAAADEGGSYSYTYNNSDERTGVEVRIPPDAPEGAMGGRQNSSFKIDYGYDLAGQLTSASRFLPDGTRDYSYNYGYSYDPMGNPSQRTSQGQTRNYTANNLNQLSSATGPNSTDVAGKVAPELVAPFNVSVNGQTATVDDKGNWIAQSVPLTQGENALTVQATDRFARTASEVRNVTLAPPPVFAYDANGNMTSDGEWVNVFNNADRLVSQIKGNDTKLEFGYDGMGRRRTIKCYKWLDSSWQLSYEWKLVYDGWNCIAELDASNTLRKSYIWGVDLSGTLQDAGLPPIAPSGASGGGVGGLLAVSDSSGTSIPAYDGNGNIICYVDATSGLAVANYEYSPFGEITRQSGSKANDFLFRWSSKRYCKESQTYDFGLRDYAPKYCRWISRDPIEEEGGINLYTMVKNNPVNLFDVLGQYECQSESVTGRDPIFALDWGTVTSGKTNKCEASYGNWATTKGAPFAEPFIHAICNSGVSDDRGIGSIIFGKNTRITIKVKSEERCKYRATCSFSYEAIVRSLTPGKPSSNPGIRFSATMLGRSYRKTSFAPLHGDGTRYAHLEMDRADTREIIVDKNETTIFNSLPAIIAGTRTMSGDWLGAEFREVYSVQCNLELIGAP